VLYAALAATIAVALILAAAFGAQAAAVGTPIEALPTRGVEGVFITAAAAFAGASSWVAQCGALALFVGLAGCALAALAAGVAACVAALADRSDVVWRHASARIAIAGFLAGVPFATNHGWEARDALEAVVFAGGPALIAAASALVIARVVGIAGLQRHLGAYSVTPPGRWWRAAVSAVAPIVLVALALATLIGLVRSPAQPPWAIVAFGLAPCVVAALFAVTVAIAGPRRTSG